MTAKDDEPQLTISATKPRGKPAAMLAEAGIDVAPILEDEGNVDRYVISKRLVIERRTGSSFLKGIMEKTLFTSAIYMREHFRIPVLIIEGKVNYEYSMMSPQAVRGALSSLMLLYGINVLSAADTEETVALIAMMTRQEQVGIPEISLIPKRKAIDIPDLQRRLIEMLPGCGMVMAREMLQTFGSVRDIINSSENSLKTVRGVGAKTAVEIHKVLSAEYKSVDTEKNLEDAIEADPKLLFRKPVTMLARQHYIYTSGKDRHIVDMVFLDPAGDELILVELKRGRLTPGHVAQLCGYLDNAHESKLLGTLLAKGAKLRGLLATVEKCEIDPGRADISVRIVNRDKVIRVLKSLRKKRRKTRK